MLPLCFPCKSFKRVVLRRWLLKHSSNASLQPKITTTNRLLSHDELLAKIASTTKEKRALSLQLTRKTEEANVSTRKLLHFNFCLILYSLIFFNFRKLKIKLSSSSRKLKNYPNVLPWRKTINRE